MFLNMIVVPILATLLSVMTLLIGCSCMYIYRSLMPTCQSMDTLHNCSIWMFEKNGVLQHIYLRVKNEYGVYHLYDASKSAKLEIFEHNELLEYKPTVIMVSCSCFPHPYVKLVCNDAAKQTVYNAHKCYLDLEYLSTCIKKNRAQNKDLSALYERLFNRAALNLGKCMRGYRTHVIDVDESSVVRLHV
jgi:hypothetical protein